MGWQSDFPAVVTANTTIKWRDEQTTVPFNETISSTEGWALTYYLRTNVAASEGLTVVGSTYTSGWEFTIAASDSANFDAGNWVYDAIATKGSEKYRLGGGSFEVKQSLIYTGTPAQIDTRTQNQKDRDNIIAALRKFEDGAQSYSIGGRSFTRVDMDKLRVRLSDLITICLREEAAEKLSQGRGSGLNLNARL